MNKVQVQEALKKYTMIIVLVLVVAFFAWQTQGRILLPQNVNNLISQNAYVFILAAGMLLCILTGGNIDLSVGSVVCFVGAVGGTIMVTWGMPVPLAILGMVVTGILIGVWQGFWIAYIRIPPFIVTLAGMLIFRGGANVILAGRTIAPMPDAYLALFNTWIVDLFGGSGFNIFALVVGIVAVLIFVGMSVRGRIVRAKKGYENPGAIGFWVKLVLISAAIIAFMFRLAQFRGIPMVLIWVVVIILVYAYITNKTTVGRHFYAVGGNEKAAALSGINTNKVYFIAYVNMSFLAAVAGMAFTARLNSANPTMGTGFELDTIAACFIGGASAYGGIGTVPGVMVGAILMGVINQGMSIMGVDANWQQVVKGAVLLAAVIFDVVSKKKTI